MGTSIERRLAAIMFTDIAGYTALMQENESAAAIMRQRHRDVFEKEHQRFNGELLQYYGDGSLSTFKSAVEAVECAISMQQQFATGTTVPLRIGLHLGDIVFDKNDIYGDGVNLASRIESLGVPGCIFISDKLYDAIKNQQGIRTTSMGHFEFKNIKDPTEVYAITNNGITVPDRSALKGKLKQNKKSIAVLPFINMSADPENEYFSDGIAEEILNALVKVQGLQVTARTSSFSFKGKNMDVREIGIQLGVSNILEGSVRKSGNRVRITAQLVSSIDGYHYFSETYDRTLEDIFAVQDEIAQKITLLLREHLGENEHNEKLVNVPTESIEAYEIYLRGLFFFNQWGPDGMGKAIPYFHKAIEADPNFVLPIARLAICYVVQTFSGKISWEEAYKNGIVYIERIKELGVESAEACFATGAFEIFYQWDWPAAVQATKKGIELFPNFSSLHHLVSTLHYIQGDMPAAVAAHKRGLEIDPMSIEMILFMGIAYLWNQDFDKSLPYFQRVIEMLPHHRNAWEYIGWHFAFKGNYKEAIEIFSKIPPEGYRLHRSTCLGWVYAKMGETEMAEKCLQELLELEKNFIGYSLDIATLYAGMSNADKALHYLEKAVKNRFGDSMMMRSDLFFKDFFNHPQFKKLEEIIGKVPSMDF